MYLEDGGDNSLRTFLASRKARTGNLELREARSNRLGDRARRTPSAEPLHLTLFIKLRLSVCLKPYTSAVSRQESLIFKSGLRAGERLFDLKLTHDTELVKEYRPGGLHPVHLGDKFHEGH
jgi:hypothetical protein